MHLQSTEIWYSRLIDSERKILDKGKKWAFGEGWKSYMKELTRIIMEGVKGNNKVVLIFASIAVPQWLLLRQLLIDAGAKDVSMIFLDSDFDDHMDAILEAFYTWYRVTWYNCCTEIMKKKCLETWWAITNTYAILTLNCLLRPKKGTYRISSITS